MRKIEPSAAVIPMLIIALLLSVGNVLNAQRGADPPLDCTEVRYCSAQAPAAATKNAEWEQLIPTITVSWVCDDGGLVPGECEAGALGRRCKDCHWNGSFVITNPTADPITGGLINFDNQIWYPSSGPTFTVPAENQYIVWTGQTTPVPPKGPLEVVCSNVTDLEKNAEIVLMCTIENPPKATIIFRCKQCGT